MWEDFMRGNWPTVAPDVPAPRTSRDAAEPATLRDHRSGGAAFQAAPVYVMQAQAQAVHTPVHAAATRTAPGGPAHAKVAPAGGSRKFAVRTVVTAGAGLLLAVVLPGAAVASAGHPASHGAHAAAVSRP